MPGPQNTPVPLHDNRYNLTAVLAPYPVDCQASAIAQPIGFEGLSGSRLWRLETPRGPLCLKRWPGEYRDAVHLRWIHEVLRGAYSAGFRRLPLPISALSGDSFTLHENHYWELTPWLPGEADPGNASGPHIPRPRIAAALKALAEFHAASKQFSLSVNTLTHPAIGLAPGISRRLAMLSDLQSGTLTELAALVQDNRNIWPALADRAPSVFEMFHQTAPRVARLLRSAASLEVPLLPCLRDIHREHLLFQEDHVTGLIDFGSMQVDNVACDIARLLGSMAGDQQSLWEVGLAAYTPLEPLSESETLLVEVYDQSGVLLAGINWLRWLFAEQRQFHNRAVVLARFDEIVGRMAHLGDRRIAVTL